MVRAGYPKPAARRWTAEVAITVLTQPPPTAGRRRAKVGGALLFFSVAAGGAWWLNHTPNPPPVARPPVRLVQAAAPPRLEAPALDAGAKDDPLLVALPRETGPSPAQLVRRLRLLEKRLRRRTLSGAEPDPSAMGRLEKQRLRLGGSLTPADRKDVSRKLDAWERTYLGR